jgi:DMSO/TMAO reductase YedYZ molybdopterin-dependent catalytic subunit
VQAVKKWLTILVMLALSLALLSVACGRDHEEKGATPTPTEEVTPTPAPMPAANRTTTDEDINEAEELPSVEIREYEGKDLSSINDFRENSIRGPQHIDLESYRLKVTGLVENPMEHTFDDVIDSHQSYQKVVTLNCVEGWSVTILWEGVVLRDLIEEAGASPDANTVIFHAYDGYTTSHPLDYIMSQDILMAHKMNSVVLPPERGAPFQLIAESKWGYKWTNG